MNASLSSEQRASGRILFATLMICVLVALFGRRMPNPLPVGADDRVFSAGRARAIVNEIARAPHPAESVELARVRDFLLEHLRSLGFDPQLEAGNANGTWLKNIFVRMPGSASTGTLLLVAHYDSVPSGPGAGDDSIGVAAWLEVLRTLRAREWQPKNDVMLLLTDAEERGLCGAQLFVMDKRLMSSVAAVVNLEAIGNGGPACLFQLGEENGACVRAFAKIVDAPAGTSLGNAVYRRMPNNTDLTRFIERGIPGFNIAITSGSAAYHAPHDSPENLDSSSVQHMGECALSLAEHLASADLAALRSPDVTFFDVLGFGMVRYSRVWDVLLAFLGCALALLACQKLRTPLRELAAHALRHVLEVALLTGAIGLLWWIIDTIVSWITPKPEWVAGNTTSGMVLFVGIQGLVGGAELRRRGDARTTASRACAIALIWSAASFASLEWLEGASFACTWPLIFAAIGILAAMTKQASRTADAIMVIGLAGALLLGLPLLQLLVQLFERVPLLAILLAGTTLASGAGLFAPAFERMRRDVPWTPRVLLGAGVLGLVASVVVARVLVWRQGALFP